MEEDKKIVGELHFSFTNEFETTTLDKVYHEDSEEFEEIYWFMEEFKYFLKAIGFTESMTEHIVYLNEGEKVINADGNVLVEHKGQLIEMRVG